MHDLYKMGLNEGINIGFICVMLYMVVMIVLAFRQYVLHGEFNEHEESIIGDQLNLEFNPHNIFHTKPMVILVNSFMLFLGVVGIVITWPLTLPIAVIVIAAKTGHYEKIVSNIQQIKSSKGKIIGIVTEGDESVKQLADHVIEVPDTLESLSPLLTTIPLQLLSYHIAVMLDRNVDQPRNLAKSVTVE